MHQYNKDFTFPVLVCASTINLARTIATDFDINRELYFQFKRRDICQVAAKLRYSIA